MGDVPLVDDETIRRVHEHECMMSGHHWTCIEVASSDVPVAILCSHCGKRAIVTEDES